MLRLSSFISILAVLFLAFTSFAIADIPHQISYQGYLTDNQGDPITDNLEMSFAIYNAAADGDSLWGETQGSVEVIEGYFSVILGSVNSIPDNVFNDTLRWLQVAVGGNPLSGRTQLVSVPYSYRVSTIDSASGGTVHGDVVVDGDVGINEYLYHNGDDHTNLQFTFDQIDLHAGDIKMLTIDETTQDKVVINEDSHDVDFRVESNNASDALFVQGNTGNVGIGTTNPIEDLHVDGDAKVTGTIITQPNYDSGWFSLTEGNSTTKYHYLDGDPTKYIVIMIGKASDESIHQANIGTTHYSIVPDRWLGCEWYGLTNDRIKIARGNDDDNSAPTKDWDRIMIRIYANQTLP